MRPSVIILDRLLFEHDLVFCALKMANERYVNYCDRIRVRKIAIELGTIVCVL